MMYLEQRQRGIIGLLARHARLPSVPGASLSLLLLLHTGASRGLRFVNAGKHFRAGHANVLVTTRGRAATKTPREAISVQPAVGWPAQCYATCNEGQSRVPQAKTDEWQSHARMSL